jgi:hypothetical protein
MKFKLSLAIIPLVSITSQIFAGDAIRHAPSFDELRIFGAFGNNGSFAILITDDGTAVLTKEDGAAERRKVTIKLPNVLFDEIVSDIFDVVQKFETRDLRRQSVASNPITVTIRRGTMSLYVRFLSSSSFTGVEGEIGEAFRKLNSLLPVESQFPQVSSGNFG